VRPACSPWHRSTTLAVLGSCTVGAAMSSRKSGRADRTRLMSNAWMCVYQCVCVCVCEFTKFPDHKASHTAHVHLCCACAPILCAHTAHVTRHTSHVTRHTAHGTRQGGLTRTPKMASVGALEKVVFSSCAVGFNLRRRLLSPLASCVCVVCVLSVCKCPLFALRWAALSLPPL
jgi:hypothetical protein